MGPNIYSPSAALGKAFSMARRPERLAGKTVGLYDNTKELADIVLEVLGKELLEKHGVKALMTRRGMHHSRPAPIEILDEMARECDVVICALGA